MIVANPKGSIGRASAAPGRRTAVALFLFVSAPGLASEMLFTGALPSYNSLVTSLSFDGSAASGWNEMYPMPYSGFVWRRASGRTDFAATGASTFFYTISSNGQVAAGGGPYPGVASGNPFRVLPDGTVQDLGRPNIYVRGFGNVSALSADGSYATGYYEGSQVRTAFRWTPQTGCVLLGSTNDGRTATGISADGSVIVGWAGHNLPFTHAFVWRDGLGITQLPWHPDTPSPAMASARAKAISGDGRTIVGWSDGLHNIDAISWVDGVPRRFDAPTGWFASSAHGVSHDGSVVIGVMGRESDPFHNLVEFISTPELGMMEARAFLLHHGASLPETAQISVSSVSGDGRSFGGSYFDPAASQYGQGFVFTIPAPGTAIIGLACTAFAARRRRVTRHA